jgi:bifunctional UDP-N-acetylglucosamine pyrophosphorylase / glucosamine-1-phosphate N-acetyltransferase
VQALDGVGEQRGERYLTDVFPVLRQRELPIAAHATRDTLSAIGVNTRLDLMNVERIARRALIDTHALNGVSFEAPDSTCIDAGVEIGEDTLISAGVTLRAGTVIGKGCRIGPQTTIEAARLGDSVVARHSFLHDCDVEDEVSIGPFAYLRPGTRVGRGAKIGTFVEVKNSTIGAGAKVPHLSYIGDADVGEEANVAAGNITANYDGRRKHRTVIGKRAKTGVHTSYVAPVRVGEGAYTGAGSVINDDVPDGALGISRPREQTNVEGYAKRVEEESGS